MKFQRITILLIVFLVTFRVQAQEVKVSAPDLNAEIPVDNTIRVGKLENGLTYFIRKNTKPEQRVQFRLVLKSGSVLEDEDQQGLAHFLEHMAFNGSENFEKNELVDYLQSVGVQFGADLNAYTSFDETVYMLPLPTDDPEIVDKGLLVLEDWAGGLSLSEEEIDKERGVVLEELRLSRSAQQRLGEQYYPVMFKGSKYADRLPIGKADILENFDYETLRRFYKDWYRPDLMAIIAVGDIDIDQMESDIKSRFGKLENPKDARPRTYSEIEDHDETYIVVAKDHEATYTQIQLLYKHDKKIETTLADYRDLVIQSLYNGMLGVRFRELTQSADPPFLGGGSNYGGFIGMKDAYSAFAAVGPGGVEKGLKALLVENERVKQHGFTAGELDRYKKVLLNSYEKSYNERDKSQSMQYASEYIRAFLQNEPIPGIEWEYEFVQSVLPGITLEEVNSLAPKWITDKNRVVIVTGSDKEEMMLPDEEKIRQILEENDGVAVEPYVDEMAAASLISKQPTPGKVTSMESIENVEIEEWTLSNGAKVVLKPTDFKNDEVRMSAFAFGGHSVVADQDYMSATNATGIIGQSGVGEFSPTDLQKYLSGKSVRVSPYIATLSQGMSGTAAPKDLETMFELIYANFTDPRKSPEAFESFITRNKGIMGNIMSNPQYYFQDQVTKIRTQNNPRGGGFPTVEDFDKIDLDRAYEIYADRFSDASEFTFFFVGNFDKEEIKPLVEKYIGGLPSTNRNGTWVDLGIRPPEGVVEEVVNKGTEPKSQVNLYFTGEYKPDPKTSYMLDVLGEALTIRLIEVLREEIGGVYGVGANGSTSEFPTPRYTLSIGFPCGPENVDKLVDATFAEIEKFKKEGVSAEVLAKVKEQQRRNREENLKENSYWVSQLRNYYYYDRDFDNFYNYEKMVDSVTGKDLQNAAKKYFNMKNYMKIVLMPEA